MSNKTIIFQPIFGQKWQQLPEVFKRHYAVREYSSDKVTATGTLSINMAGFLKLFGPLIGFFGILPPKSAEDIPVTVTYSSRPDSNAFYFDRTFYYPNRKPFSLKTKMIPLGENVIVELTKCNLGWKFTCDFVDNQVKLMHQAFVFKIFKWYLPLPIHFILGKCSAQEIPLSDSAFNMGMQFTHPRFGFTYEYHGTFKIKD